MWNELRICGFFALMTFGLSDGSQENLTPVVSTSKGPVQGEILKTVWRGKQFYSFKGIPYGKPPTGNLRFKPPIEVEPWQETKLVTVEGPGCVQRDFVNASVISGNEDCLYLNVYTTRLPSQSDRKLRSVMVWIYGGSFKQGYGNSSVYGPDFFMEEDVVLVTFNYRLGALGFLSADHPDATGNAGLKDQLLVLQWVKQNIASFGGNPQSVTIFGFSAGAVSVDLHVVSERSRGLFQRSIAMSGSFLCPWGFHSTEVARNRAFDLGATLGHTTDSADDLLQFLYNAPAEDIVMATQKITKMDLPFKPTVENTLLASPNDIFIGESPMDSYKKGNFAKQPHMMGYAEHEMVVFARKVANTLETINNGTAFMNSLLESLPLLKTLGLNELLRIPDTMAAIDALSDLLFVSEIDMKQRMLQPINIHPIYYYRLSYDSPYAMHRTFFHAELNGASHADDFGYIFHTPIVDVPTDVSSPLSTFRRKMTRLWANFAKSGNPTPNGARDKLLKVSWPASGPTGRMLDLNNDLTVHGRLTSRLAQTAEPIVMIIAAMFTGRGDPTSTSVSKLF